MNFGIYTELQATRGSDHGQRYKDTMREIEVADELVPPLGTRRDQPTFAKLLLIRAVERLTPADLGSE